MIEKLDIDVSGGSISCTVTWARRRTMAIYVRRDGSVDVRVPLRTGRNSVRAFVESRKEWIVKHSSVLKEKHEKEERSFHDGEIHYYLGKPVIMRVIPSKRNRISFDGKNILLEAASDLQKSGAEKLLNSLYRGLAAEVFRERMEAMIHVNRQYNFKPTGLKIRTMVSRWGSCSSNGTITLNSNLIKKPVELIDYVILHELCHLVHRNHGPGFYHLLKTICPDYKSYKIKLRYPS